MRSDFLLVNIRNQLCPQRGLTFKAGDLILFTVGTLCLFKMGITGSRGGGVRFILVATF